MKIVNELNRELYEVCCKSIQNPDCANETKQMALFIKQSIEADEKYQSLLEKFYQVKEQRDRFLGFCRAVCPSTEKDYSLWDHEIGNMYKEMSQKNKIHLIELLEQAANFCPEDLKQKILSSCKKNRSVFLTHPSRLLLALHSIAEANHHETRRTAQGLRDIARAALEEINPLYDFSFVWDTDSGDEV